MVKQFLFRLVHLGPKLIIESVPMRCMHIYIRWICATPKTIVSIFLRPLPRGGGHLLLY